MGDCAAYNCTNSNKKGFRMHSFPICNKSNAERKKKWIINCKQKNWIPTKSAQFCEIHLEDLQYEGNCRDGWKKLQQTAIPMIFHVLNLLERFDQERKSLYKNKETIENNGGNIIENSNKLCAINPKSWSPASIIKGIKPHIALGVHGYKYLYNSKYPISAYSTITERLNKFHLKFGIFENILEALTYKTIACHLTNGTIDDKVSKNFILDCDMFCQKVGLQLLTIGSDMGSEYRKFWQYFGV
ncbi:hypothetical protein PGB90_005337 [Kerria lacca]